MSSFLSYVHCSCNRNLTIEEFCYEICISPSMYYAIQSERRQVSGILKRSVKLYILENNVFISDEDIPLYFSFN